MSRDVDDESIRRSGEGREFGQLILLAPQLRQVTSWTGSFCEQDRRQASLLLSMPDAPTAEIDQPSDTAASDPAQVDAEPKYAVTKAELELLKDLHDARMAVKLVHSLNDCPECPSSFGEYWWELDEEAQGRVAITIALMVANIIDERDEIHSHNLVNERRMASMVAAAATPLLGFHPCKDGHSGCG